MLGSNTADTAAALGKKTKSLWEERFTLLEREKGSMENGNQLHYYYSSYPSTYGTSALDLSLFEPRESYVRSSKKQQTHKTRSMSKNSASSKNSKSGKSKSAPAARQRTKSKTKIGAGGIRMANRAILTRWVSLAVVAALVITMLVIGRMQYYELVVQIDNASRELQELQQDYEAMRVSFDTKMSDSVVEDYAVNELKMQKRENSQTEYVTLGGGEVFEVTSTTSADWMDNKVDRLTSFIG